VIVWQNARYVRWAPYIGQFREITSSVIAEFLELVSVSAIKLEYWDRFNWTGTWTDFDASHLIRPSAMGVANGWQQWRLQWHSHSGWFEQIDGYRRLINVNIDLIEQMGKPSVLVATLMQDEPRAPEYGSEDATPLDEKYIFTKLELLHRDLKQVLASVLTDDMINRISLNAELSS
jgi:uncharacterized protein (TIGR04255 family)